MGEASAIEWTEATWNPWMGCTKVSPGCAHCYMFREQRQYGRDPETVVRSKTKFHEPMKWAEGRLVFTCSWSDWFHEGADAWRDEAWEIIRQTPQHTYQILTKRPERMAGRLPWGDYGDPWPNVWLGVSIENQRYAHRADILATLPATVRFVSAEPLLGPLVLGPRLRGIDWLIAGGESGPKARPMAEAWAASLRDECAASGTAYFLKQLGGWPNKRGGEQATLDGQRWTQMPTPRLSSRATP
jgi:protein gp37